jgi:L-lactate dehydrogenase complex protein LldG
VARTPTEAGDYVRAAVAGRTFAASKAPILAQCGVQGPIFRARTYSKVDVGITSADYALAETGSLVVLTESSESRLLSLLPPCHIAVVARSRIVENLEELLTLLPEPTAASSAMVNHHRPQPDRRYRDASGARCTRPRGNSRCDS